MEKLRFLNVDTIKGKHKKMPIVRVYTKNGVIAPGSAASKLMNLNADSTLQVVIYGKRVFLLKDHAGGFPVGSRTAKGYEYFLLKNMILSQEVMNAFKVDTVSYTFKLKDKVKIEDLDLYELVKIDSVD